MRHFYWVKEVIRFRGIDRNREIRNTLVIGSRIQAPNNNNPTKEGNQFACVAKIYFLIAKNDLTNIADSWVNVMAVSKATVTSTQPLFVNIVQASAKL